MGDQQNQNSEILQDLLETSSFLVETTPLETAIELNTIINLIENPDTNLNLVSFFSEHDDGGLYILYDELVDSIFETQIANPIRIKFGELLTTILEHDPMLLHERKKRISKEDQVYGFSESISENYLSMNGPNANAAITTLYELLVSYGYVPVRFKKFADGKPDERYRLREHGLSLKAGLVRFAEPEEDEEYIIEDEQIQELETMYENICKNRDNRTDDLTHTHDLSADADILVFIINNKHYCYQKRQIYNHLQTGNLFNKWIKKDDASDWRVELHNNELFNIVNFDSGYGGIGGRTTYVQLMIGPTVKMLFDMNGIIALLEHNFIPLSESDFGDTFTNVFDVTVSIPEERVGEQNTNFGSSQTHGQNDVVTIYTLTPVFKSEDEDIQDFITYQRENMNELMTKMKDESTTEDPEINIYDTATIVNALDFYRERILTDEDTETENAKSYMVMFTDEEFLKTVPLNQPSVHGGDMVNINTHDGGISSLFGTIRRIYRVPEVPDDRIVKWIYDITPFYEPGNYFNRFTINDESLLSRIVEPQAPPYDPEQAMRNGDDISDSGDESGEDLGEILRDVNDWTGDNEDDRDDNYNNPTGNLFGSDSDDDDDDVPEVSFEIDRRGNHSPMRLEELMDSPNSSAIIPTSPQGPPPVIDNSFSFTPDSPRTPPPSTNLRQNSSRFTREEEEEEPEPNSDTEVGFGGKKNKRNKKTKCKKNKKKNKQTRGKK